MYTFGAQVVAMRDNGTLYYLHGDNLGSASLTTNASGAVVSQNRYYPFGATRFTQGTRPTDVDFTGQRLDGTGLHFYNARYYSSGLGRFVSADTIVPEPGSSQAFNRYMYGYNNPLKYTDPSGHWVESAIDIAFIGYDLWDISQNGLNWENGLSLAADVGGLLLPVVTGGGLAVRATFHADDVVKVLTHADDVVKVANAADNLADASKTLDNLADAANAVCSFSAETLVSTVAGYQPISALEPGDVVLAYHEGAGATGYYTVTATWSHLDQVIEYVTIDGEVVEVTPEHPFFTAEKGWVAAGDLWLGAHVAQAEGDYGTVEDVAFVYQLQAMYNLTVAGAHTYFVGVQQWLVHNACPIKNPVQPYEVGFVDDLKTRSPGDGLDIHHAPQSNPASQVIPGYNSKTAPGIALPEAVHDALNGTNLRGPYFGSPRDLLAKTIWDLRNVKVSNNVLQQLVDLNRKVYPRVFAK